MNRRISGALLSLAGTMVFAGGVAARESAPEDSPDTFLDSLIVEQPASGNPPKAAEAPESPAPASPGSAPAAEAATTQEPSDDLPIIPVAQKEEPLPPNAPRTPRARPQLEEIVVTATKREQSVREVPISINAIRGEDLEKQGARDVKDFLMQVPGVTLDESDKGEAGGRRFTIRGVGPLSTEGNQAVGQFIGDVPLTDPVGNRFTPDLDPFDLKTVEVLKGPQGTAFGGTALNGAIRYVPNTPELDSWSGRGFAEANSVTDGGKGSVYGLAGNIPIGEHIALRGSGVLQNAAGLYDNLQRNEEDADARRKWSVRGQALVQPLEGLSANLLYLQQETRADDLLFADNPDRFDNDGKPGPSSADTRFSLGLLDVRYVSDEWGTLVWQGARQTKDAVIDQDATLVYPVAQSGIETTRAYSNADIGGDTQELRWVSANDGDWNWIIGVFYMKYDSTSQDEITVKDPAGLGSLLDPLFDLLPYSNPHGLTLYGTDRSQVVKEKSVYGELARKLGQNWEVTLGLRRYDTRLNAIIRTSGLLGPIVGAINGGATQAAVIEQKDQGYNPRLSISWRPSDELMVYATLSRGFQFGGTNNAPLFPFENPIQGTWPLEYGSSKIWNREIGIRTDWRDGTLRLDTTLYDIDWTDAQVQQSTAEGHILGATFTQNVGKVRSQGVEASLTWLTPIDGLSSTLNAAYSRARTAEDLDANGEFYASGTWLPVSPHWQGSTAVNYGTSFGSWVSNAAMSYTYWSKAYSSLSHQFEIYDFGILGINLSTARPDWAMSPSLTLGVTNLLNERGVVGRFGGGTQGYAATLNEVLLGTGWTFMRPRTISLRFSAEF